MTSKQLTQTALWKVDKAHSAVEFEVKHLMIATVRGRFREFDATLSIDEEAPENSWAEATIEVASIDTNVADRDAHLRSDDFFNAEQFPHIRFKSTRVVRTGERTFRLIGDLTIRDVTREVELEGEYLGRIVDPWGNDRIAFDARTEISRSEFNVRWNQALETGGLVVSDNVKVYLHVEAVRQS